MNKVILIGGNHHNILGLVRSFGVKGIQPYGIIVGKDAEKSFARKSKYWTKTWTVEKDEELVDFLIAHFSRDEKKPVIICASDLSAEVIDLHYDMLKEYFLLPSIAETQGKIAELMDKQKQVELAPKYGIPMAKSCVVDLEDIHLSDDIIYPCIVKPLVSAEGKKSDIHKCDTKEQVLLYLKGLKKLGYSRLLIQEFLEFESEYVMVGALSQTNCCWFNSKKIRMWPAAGGSSSYLQITDEKDIQDFYDKIRNVLMQIGYDGIFDVEALRVGEKIYLNEINWRNSGTIYSVFGTKIYYPVEWYSWKTGCSILGKPNMSCDDTEIYTMDESLDLRHVACGNISLRQWMKDKRCAKSFAIWNSMDFKPAIIEYLHLIKEFVRRRGVKNETTGSNR